MLSRAKNTTKETTFYEVLHGISQNQGPLSIIRVMAVLWVAILAPVSGVDRHGCRRGAIPTIKILGREYHSVLA